MIDHFQSPVFAELGPQEMILWSGTPKQGILLRKFDTFLIPISMFWVYILFWGVVGNSLNIVNALIFLLGLYLFIGRFFLDAIIRSKTYYAVTNERAIILSGLLKQSMTSIDLHAKTAVYLEEQREGRGAIVFGHISSAARYSGIPWFGIRRRVTPEFEFILDAQTVYTIIQQTIADHVRENPASLNDESLHSYAATKPDVSSGEICANPIPNGLTLIPSEQDTLFIHHRRTGMGCMNVFLVVWLIGWIPFCISLILSFLNGNRTVVSLGIALLGVVGGFGCAAFLVYSLFCRKSFRLDRLNLTIHTSLLGFKSNKSISLDSIKRFVQVQDGGKGKDSFPSWGLKTEGAKQATLLFRQPYETSHWLGQTLAEWAGVEFVEAPRK